MLKPFITLVASAAVLAVSPIVSAQEERPIAAQAQIMQRAVQSEAGSEVYTRGAITAIKLVAQGSDDYGRYRGVLTLDFVGTGATDYHWGGSTCPGRDLTGEQVQILVIARAHGLKVTPEQKRGQGGALCLTGFTLTG